MDSLWKKDIVSINNVKTPKDIIQEQCERLSELTDGNVVAIIKEYEGEYKSRYEAINPDQFEMFFGSTDKLINKYNTFTHYAGVPKNKIVSNIQNTLGENINFVYEFYITSRNTPKYKYRICFIYYSAIIYPVGISLEKSISDEIQTEDPEFQVNDESEFITLLSKILSTDRVTAVINNLYNMNVNDLF